MAYEDEPNRSLDAGNRAEVHLLGGGPVKSKHRVAHENKALLLALCSGSAAVILSFVLLFTGDFSSQTRWTLGFFVIVIWFAFAMGVRSVVMRPLQTLSNIVSALREEDFSIRARSARSDDALGEVVTEINQLSRTLREQRLGALEASALLGKVISEIDVALFAFDARHRLRLINRAGERLLSQAEERALGKTAEELGLGECLEGPASRTLDLPALRSGGRWGMRRSTFRQSGATNQLVVISDLSHALREEERSAWQRLVRVLGHELNNSLAPVRSIAESLEMLLKRDPRPDDWEQDMRQGLRIISDRSEALTRFMRDYARLTRLPKPQLSSVDLPALIQRIAGLEQRLPVEVSPGPPLRVEADGDQIEQLLINVIRNAADASLETHRGVNVSWTQRNGVVEVSVRDEGKGISNPSNLFVPFFTTKPGGSGIGLALSRQIAEAHGGTLLLQNRADDTGCEAILRMPVRQR